MNTPQNTDTIPNFKWMPGMLAMDEADYTHRVIHVDYSNVGGRSGPPLIDTETNGGSPWALGLVAVDTSDPTTAACLAHLSNTNHQPTGPRP